MALQKLASKSLLSVTLATGLIIANTFSSALATEIPTALSDTPATVEQKSLLGRMVATSLGTLSGMVAYSLVTGDWGWALLVTSSSIGASAAVPAAATVGTTTAAAGTAAAGTAAAGTAGAVAAEVAAATAASTAAPAAAVGAAEVVAATTGAAVPVAATATPAAGATVTSTSATIAGILTNRWAPVTASGLAGAILGNVIYSYK